MGDDGPTVWSVIADESWEAQRLQLDWMTAPGMYGHVAELMGGSWLSVICDQLEHIAQASGHAGVRMLAIGCGDARIEAAGLERGWPISQLVCAERDSVLLQAAKGNLNAFEGIQIDFISFDMDNPKGPTGAFDVVFFCHSLHHCSAPEQLLAYINRALAPGGVIMGMDYFGNPRCQPAYEVLGMLNETYAALPARLQRNLLTGETSENLKLATPAEVATHDPSEAPRSSDIRGLLFSLFPVIDMRPMGGTLLRPLINLRAGNFTTDADHALLAALQLLERNAIRSRAIPSDDIYFVVGRSDRI